MTTDQRTITSGGVEYEAAWLRCRATASIKRGEAIVSIVAQGTSERLCFFVDAAYVRPGQLPHGDEVEAEVKVMLLDRNDGTVLVKVAGEAVSYGPRFPVARDLLVEPTAS